MRTTSRTVAPEPPTEAQARASMAAYINAHLKESAIVLATNKKIEAIKKQAAEDAREHVAEKARHETVLMQYAEAHPELFKDARKAELFGGHKIGYHTSPPAVTLIRPTGEKKKQTWDGFVSACKRIGAHWLTMIRTVEEPDKEAVLYYHRTSKARAEAEKDPSILADAAAQLGTLGVAVTQEEKFVIDLNLQEPTEAAATITKEAA